MLKTKFLFDNWASMNYIFRSRKAEAMFLSILQVIGYSGRT